jgi:hypothetical protein
MSLYNWAAARPNLRWATTDEDGAVVFHTERPTAYPSEEEGVCGRWTSNGSAWSPDDYFIRNRSGVCRDWESTLQERPDLKLVVFGDVSKGFRFAGPFLNAWTVREWLDEVNLFSPDDITVVDLWDPAEVGKKLREMGDGDDRL